MPALLPTQLLSSPTPKLTWTRPATSDGAGERRSFKKTLAASEAATAPPALRDPGSNLKENEAVSSRENAETPVPAEEQPQDGPEAPSGEAHHEAESDEPNQSSQPAGSAPESSATSAANANGQAGQSPAVILAPTAPVPTRAAAPATPILNDLPATAPAQSVPAPGVTPVIAALESIELPAPPQSDVRNAPQAGNGPIEPPTFETHQGPLQATRTNHPSPLSPEVFSGTIESRIPSAPATVPVAETAPANPNPSTNDQPSDSDRRTAQNGREGESSAPKPPAIPAAMRALQMDAAIRMENVNGQAGERAAIITAPSAPAARLDASIAGPRTSADLIPNPPKSADDVPATGQVLRGLTAMVQQRGGIMSLRLDPPELGELRVQMTISRGVVSAEFLASTAQAHGLLEKNLSSLRATLENQGLAVDRLSVNMNSQPGQSFMRGDSDRSDNGQPRGQDHNAAGGESRGRRDGDAQDSPRRHSLRDFVNVLDDFGRPAAS